MRGAKAAASKLKDESAPKKRISGPLYRDAARRYLVDIVKHQAIGPTDGTSSYGPSAVLSSCDESRLPISAYLNERGYIVAVCRILDEARGSVHTASHLRVRQRRDARPYGYAAIRQIHADQV